MSLYEFNVLIASGTGVMTAASVLKEAAHCNRVRPLVFITQLFNSQPPPPVVPKEVVFVWVVEDETGLEWLIDIIREVEDKITVATFITKLRDDFNFRTSMIVSEGNSTLKIGQNFVIKVLLHKNCQQVRDLTSIS